MRVFSGYLKGVNLGGWLSQCPHTKEHYDSFITQRDFETIASWGLDHVRLPVDYNLVQDAEGNLIEENFSYISNCIEWCKKNGLNMILDLHKTRGYSFDKGDNEEGLFEDENLMINLIGLWEEFAKRYGKETNVAFELLNELVEPGDNDSWMRVARKTVAVIRFYAPETKVLIGGYYNNSIEGVKDIAEPFDKNIVYTFHCYEPLLFTHQGAHWVDGMNLDFRMSYPVSREEYFAALEKGNGKSERFRISDRALTGEKFDAEYFRNLFAEAINVAEERDVALYCGEYGVIDLADLESSINWLRDINSIFQRYGIGRAIWNYRDKDFGLTGKRFDSVRDELVKLL